MRKPDEIALAREMLEYGPYGDAHHIELMVDTGTPISPAWRRIGMNEKRACYIFTKWARRGWSDSDISLRHSWLTSEGVDAWTTILSICDPTDSECVSSFMEYVRIRFSGALVLCDEVDRRSCCKSVAHNFGSYCVMQDGTYIHMCTVTFLE